MKQIFKEPCFVLQSTNTEYVYKLNIQEVNSRTWLKCVCTCLLLSFREMSLKAKRVYGVICKTQGKI